MHGTCPETLGGGDEQRSLMRNSRVSAAAVAIVIVAGAVAGCSSGKPSITASSGKPSATAASAGPQLTACPQSSSFGGAGGAGAGGGAAPSGSAFGGSGASGGAGGTTRPTLPVATTVKQINNGASTVIDPTGPAIQCGQLQLSSYDNVVYDTPTTNGKKVSLVADILVPKTGGTHPLVIYLPGGGFFAANPNESLNQRTYIADQGYVVASISYRTESDGANYVAGVADAKSAIRFLRAHASAYGIDPNEVAVWGESAGGYIASMVGVTAGIGQFEDGDNPGQSDTVQAVVDEFGPSNLSEVAADFNTSDQVAYASPKSNITQWVLGPATTKTLAQEPAAATASDPLTYVTASDPPFILMQGTDDTLVSPSQTLILFNALRAKGDTATRIALKGAGHGEALPGVSTASTAVWSTQMTMGYITRFLGKYLGG
jgi:acetyl esterase/lipase